MAHGTITICCECGRQKVDGGWVAAPITENAPRISHGMCNDCVRKLYPEDADWIIKRARDTEAAKRAQEIGV